MEITYDGRKFGDPTMFKIDLIVWKSSYTSTTGTHSEVFKIDLIVWKFLSMIISLYTSLCLK